MTVEEIIARAYEAEEASQMGEPSPWSVAFDDAEWVSERLHCAKAVIMALEAAGYVVVPREPTETMTVNGGLGIEKSMFEDQDPLVFDGAKKCYAAMIASRPK